MRLSIESFFLTSTLAFMQSNVNHAFTIIHNNKSNNKSKAQSRPTNNIHTSSYTHTINHAKLDNTEIKINGEISIQDKIESIRQEAIYQYEEAMEYYMFELGNDIVFLSNHDEVSNYITTHFDTIIFDCDGVLYRGGNTNTPIPESSNALRYLLNDQKKQVLFLTNNAQYSREELCIKLSKIFDSENEGFLLKNEQMITSSYSTAKYLEDQLLLDHEGDNGDNDSSEGCNKNVVVIGSNGLCDEIEKFGFHVKSLTNILNNDDNNDENHAMDRTALASYSFESMENFDDNNSPSLSLSSTRKTTMDAIVVGLDTSFTFQKLCIVSALIKHHPNALFIATNEGCI